MKNEGNPPRLKELIPAGEIQRRVGELGDEISGEFSQILMENDPPLILLGVLKGGFMFLADLARAITIPVEIEFVSLSSYGNEQTSSGEVELRISPPIPLKNRCVLVVEDIVDTGRSLSKLLQHLRSLGPKEVRICAMLDKPEARVVEIQADYVGFTVPHRFVVGYGLDAAQRFRQLPGIFLLQEPRE